MSGSKTQPPGGSVFSSVTGRDGPPMMRMIIIQVIFASLSKMGRLHKGMKIAAIVLVCVGLTLFDANNFFKKRQPNIYEKLGVKRTANLFEIDAAVE